MGAGLDFLRKLDPVYGKSQPCFLVKRADRFLRQLAACLGLPAVACRRRHFKAGFCRSLGHRARTNACEFGGGVTVKASGERQIDAPLGGW